MAMWGHQLRSGCVALRISYNFFNRRGYYWSPLLMRKLLGDGAVQLSFDDSALVISVHQVDGGRGMMNVALFMNSCYLFILSSRSTVSTILLLLL